MLAATARHSLGLLRMAQGDHRAGMHALAGAQGDFQELAQSDQASDAEHDLADACLRQGLWTEAQARLRMLINRLQRRSDAPALPWLWLQLAEAQAPAGQTAAALSSLARAQVQFSQRSQCSGWVQAELARLRMVLAVPMAPDDAAQLAAQARALHTRLAAPCAAPDRLQTRHPLADGTALLQARWLESRAHRLGGALSTALALLPRLCGPQTLAEAPALHALAWAEAGLAYQAQGDLAAASSALDHAINRLDDLHWALPCGTGTPDFGTATADALLQACTARLALAAADAPAEQTLCWLHRQRVRQLRPLLASADILRLATPEQRVQLQAWRVRHAWLQRAHRRARQDDQPGHPGSSMAALHQVEQALLSRSQRLRRARWPGESALLDGENALDTSALRHHFRQGRALVAYGEVHGRVLALVIAQGEVHRILLPAQVADLAAALHRLRLPSPLLDTAGSTSDLMPESWLLARCPRRLQRIHQQIWAPLETALDGADDLVVVPSPALQALPFAALHDGRQWLDQRCRLRQAATMAGTVARGTSCARAAVAATGAGMRTATPRTRAELAAA
ncbi:MAG: hypothetical protein QE285_14145, partial [Aquabacterium sp.]|nr:hypothetical protein [Aquabacterium sp.]